MNQWPGATYKTPRQPPPASSGLSAAEQSFSFLLSHSLLRPVLLVVTRGLYLPEVFTTEDHRDNAVEIAESLKPTTQHKPYPTIRWALKTRPTLRACFGALFS